ncbi:MAG: hypothetical protein JWM80_2811 [Cyanobacteria bacterium RYN_339]|nr:hypothetical protein [Cyanobacteria bacterium RYN_339]
MTTINNTLSTPGFQPKNIATPGVSIFDGANKVAIGIGDRYTGPAIDPIWIDKPIFKPSLKQLEFNVLKAAGHKSAAEDKVEQAEQALADCKNPMEAFMARRELATAKKDLGAAKLELAKAQVALAERKVEDADKAVSDAERAVMTSGNPISRVLAMRQLETAVKNQTKAQESLDKAQGQLQALETQLFPFPIHPPIILNDGQILHPHIGYAKGL